MSCKPIKHFFKKITGHPLFIAFLSRFLYYYSRLVGKTTCWELCGADRFYQTWEQDKAVILLIWHGRAMMLPHFWNKKRPLNALVSLHKDGRIIAGFLEKYGFGTIGGSTNEGAQAAARGLLHSLQKNEAIAIIPDGPVGPRMKMNDSPLYFAMKSGKPIFGATYSVAHSLVAKSWDAMLIPPPFCRGSLRITKPYYIPAGATAADLARYRQEIEDEMNELTLSADKNLGLEPIAIGVCAKKKRYPRIKETTKPKNK